MSHDSEKKMHTHSHLSMNTSFTHVSDSAFSTVFVFSPHTFQEGKIIERHK